MSRDQRRFDLRVRIDAVLIAAIALALSLVRPCVAQAPSEAARLNNEGSRLLQADLPEAALAEFRAAAALEPSDLSIQFNIGLTLVRLGRYEEALDSLEKATGDPPSSMQARFLRGMIFFQQDAYEEAARELEVLRENTELGDQVLYVLVESYRQLGKVRPSQQAFLELKQRYPDSAFGHKLMGMAFAHESRYEDAVNEFTKALEAKPDLPEAAFAVGYIYFEQRQHKEARPWLEKELTVQPCFAKAHYYLGEIERQAGDWEAAATLFQKARRCDPAYGESYLGLGQCHIHRGELEKAIAVLKDAADLAPDSAKVRYWLARALRARGRSEEAEAELSKVKRIHSESYGRASANLDRHRLAPEERQILSWVLRGEDSPQIARRLSISPEAAEARLVELIRRFNVQDAEELALYTLSHGLLAATAQQAK